MNTAVPTQKSGARPRDYFTLLKPRVMALVVFTALVGMTSAATAGAQANLGLAVVSILAIAVGAGASGALNMWWDADIDAVMARTHLRPIPQGVVPKPEAANFGLVLSALAVALLALASNYLAAGLLAFTIFFYVVVYSMWLKRVTPQNIVIGGAAGALPPVVGWAAVSGDAPLAAWTLFLIVFLWTPPHFWALSLYRESDYARADIPMMPVVKGERSTRRQIFAYAILLALAALGPFTVGIAGQAYLAAASAGSAAFLFLSFRLLTAESGSKAEAKTLFAYSLLYLFALFAVLLAEDLWAMYV